MSDEPVGKLLSAADHLDDARTDLRYGDHSVGDDDLDAKIVELDDAVRVVEQALRKTALLANASDSLEDGGSDA